MPKLTKRIIDAVEPEATEFSLCSEGTPGLGLREMTSGRKGFVVQFRAERRARPMMIRLSTVLTGDQARTRAITIIAAIKNGDDPAAKRDAKRNAAMRELAVRFDRDYGEKTTIRLERLCGSLVSSSSYAHWRGS